MIRQDSSWHLHISQEAREYRWETLKYAVAADFHWMSALIEDMEWTAAEIIADWYSMYPQRVLKAPETQ